MKMAQTEPAVGAPLERHVRPRAQRPSGYPTELVAKAKYEMRVFERVSAETGAELIAEVERLRAEIERHTPPPAWVGCGA
jgi:hypothetical protein